MKTQLLAVCKSQFAVFVLAPLIGGFALRAFAVLVGGEVMHLPRLCPLRWRNINPGSAKRSSRALIGLAVPR